MKKLLIGTTALVAAGSLATGAQAADPIKMGVGGYFQSLMAIADQEDHAASQGANRESVWFTQEAEIIFNGSTKLDNGVTVGAQVQLEAETQGDQIDETYIYFSGGFGRINVGEENSASYLMHTGTPTAGFGLNSPNFRLYNGGAAGGNVAAGFFTTRNTASSDSNKFTYFTPRIGGLQGGISYASGGAGIASEISNGVGAPADNGAGAHGQTIDIGVNFVKKFGGVGVRLSGGYATSNLEVAAGAVNDDRVEWNVGAQVSVAGFTVGAAYHNDNNGRSAANSDVHAIAFGATYGRGAWKVGAEYVYHQAESALTGGVASHEYTAIQLSGSYTLGPGVRLVGGLQIHDMDDNIAGNTAADNEAVVFYIGTALSF